MASFLLILLLGGILVLATVGWVVGLKRFLLAIGCEPSFDYELMLAFACVFPECLATYHAMGAPGRLPGHTGEPFIAVGVTLGSAAANMLVIGMINAGSVKPIGATVTGTRRSLEMAAILLLIGLLTFSGLVMTRHRVSHWVLLLVGWGPLAALVACLRFIHEPQPKRSSNFDRDLFASTRPKPHQALILAGLSILGLAYGLPAFIDTLIPWFHELESSPIRGWGPSLSMSTIVLGMLLAMPDLVLAIRDLRSGADDPPTPRLLLSGAFLMSIAAIAGLTSDRLWHAAASSMLEIFWLIVAVVSLVLILLLVKPDRSTAQTGGVLIVGIVVAGYTFLTILIGR